MYWNLEMILYIYYSYKTSGSILTNENLFMLNFIRGNSKILKTQKKIRSPKRHTSQNFSYFLIHHL
jgi:hypothetical protein